MIITVRQFPTWYIESLFIAVARTENTKISPTELTSKQQQTLLNL